MATEPTPRHHKRHPAGTDASGLGPVDYRKEFRQLYTGSEKRVEIVHAPRMNYLAVDGIGDPTDAGCFDQAADALCRVSVEARLNVSRAGVMDFALMPLECIWWNEDPAVESPGGDCRWTLMIMQPVISPFILMEATARLARSREQNPLLESVKLVKFYEGPAAQTLTRSTDPVTSEARDRIRRFIAENGYTAQGSLHEIFLDGLCFEPRRRTHRLIRQPFIAAP